MMVNNISTATQPNDLLPVLHRLDTLLDRALSAAAVAYGPDAGADPFRGLHIGRGDVARLLARAPGEPLLAGGAIVSDGLTIAGRNGSAGRSAGLPQPSSAGDTGSSGTRSNGNGATSPPLPSKSGRSSLFGHWGRTRSDANENGNGALAATSELLDSADLGIVDTADTMGSSQVDETVPDLAGDHARLQWLAGVFGLSRFDVNLMVIALAPELDLRYERLYAYLQDDVMRKRPSVDLALNLLCSTAESKWARRAHVASDSPLAHPDLVTLVPDPNQPQPLLLSHALKLDDRIVDHLLGHDHIDDRLARAVRWVDPRAAGGAALSLADDDVARLDALLEWYRARTAEGQPTGLPILLHGPGGAGKRDVAEAVCRALGTGLLAVDVGSLLQADLEPAKLVRLVFREAILLQTPLYWDGFDRLLADDERARAVRAALVEQLDALTGLTFLAGQERWVPAGALQDKAFISLEVPVPAFAARCALWEAAFDGLGDQAIDGLDLHALANQFRFGPGQVRDSIATARNRALARDPADGRVTMDDLFAACRVHSRHKLGALARRIRPVYGWDDIVLPADQVVQLREVCQSVRYRPTVYADWGFERKLARGKGLSVIFAGPSGTGKTMAAEIIAGELGLDLFKIDLSTVVSKYIGETEKNLERIFGEAQMSNAILFFDEADALFGKRSEVKDAHDRYANIEISYLLQRMEEYDGIVILATNLKSNLDEAFVRRMQFIVDFPFPEEADRLGIWQKIWPEETPRENDLDLGFMARQFRITGGNIKNIAVAGAFLAAADGGTVTMRHVVQSTRREYQKMGKLCTEAEFGPYFEWVRG